MKWTVKGNHVRGTFTKNILKVSIKFSNFKKMDLIFFILKKKEEKKKKKDDEEEPRACPLSTNMRIYREGDSL